MMDREKSEIDRIVCEIADDGVSADRIQKLESLLLNRPDLQSHYVSMIRLGTLLRCEIGDGSLQPMVESREDDSQDILAEHCCRSLVNRVERDVTIASGARQLSFFFAGLAAVLMVGVGLYLLPTFGGSERPLAHQTASGDVRPFELHPRPEASGDTTLASLRVRDAHQLEVLSRLTRTEAIHCLWLPRRESQGVSAGGEDGWELSRGTAWIDSSIGGRERGYVLSIPPGVRMEMNVDTDASCKNALGMVELNAQGRISGSSISFNNLSPGTSPASERITGCIGQYSVSNDSTAQKNFLIAGSYCVEKADGTGGWKQSDYAILYESADFLVIGFDDSGYPDVEIGEVADRDRDFNDMCAFIHFSSDEERNSRSQSGVTYVPAPLQDPANCVEQQSGYVLDIRPGEKLLLAVSSSARLQNSVRIIDATSRQVVWQHDGTEPGTQASKFQQGQRGVYLIYNDSDVVRSYELQGRFIDEGDETWVDSPCRVTDEGDNWVSIGFEDSPDIPKLVDWNDIRVHAWWYAD